MLSLLLRCDLSTSTSLFAALPRNNFSYLRSTSSIIIHHQSLFIFNLSFVSISSSAVSSLNNICHKCTSVLNKKTGTVAPDGSSNSPVDSLREKVGLQRRTLLMKLRHYYDFLKKETNSLVASLEHFSRYLETNLRYLEKKNFPKHIQVNISDI